MSIYAVNGKEPIAAWIESLDPESVTSSVATDLVVANHGTLTSMDLTADPETSRKLDADAGGSRALYFDGSNDRVITTDSAFSFVQNTFVYGISFWVRILNTSGRYSLIGNAAGTADKGFCVLFENGAGVGTKAIRIYVNYGTIGMNAQAYRSPDNAIADTDWHHVLITSNAATTRSIYVDGVSLSITPETQSAIAATGSSTRPLALGVCNHSALFLPSLSAQDDHRIFNQFLDADDAAYLSTRRGIVASSGKKRPRINGSLINSGLCRSSI